MKKLLFLAAICLPLLFVSCEKRVVNTGVTIYGTVYDAETNDPIQGAMLTLQPSSRSCYTGSDGSFNFKEDIEPMQYTIIAQATGYRADTKHVTPMPGEKTEVSFKLKKE